MTRRTTLAALLLLSAPPSFALAIEQRPAQDDPGPSETPKPPEGSKPDSKWEQQHLEALTAIVRKLVNSDAEVMEEFLKQRSGRPLRGQIDFTTAYITHLLTPAPH